MEPESHTSTVPENMRIALEHHQAGRLVDAETVYLRVLALNPDSIEAHINLGNVLRDLRRLEEAEQSYRQALVFKPDFVEAHINLGNVLSEFGRLDEAERSYCQALTLKPGHAFATFNYSLLRLLQGDYRSGFQLYESRFGIWNLNTNPFSYALLDQLKGTLRWQGEEVRGGKLLLWTEQGLGDSLMMMRYLPRLKGRGFGQLVIYCEPGLVRTMQTIPAVDDVISKQRSLSPEMFDCHCPMMSLPLMFNTRLESIPNEVPYLHIPDDLKRKWVDRFADMNRPRVGLVWAGKKILDDDVQRSIRLKHFFPLFDIDGVNFISLQKGEEAGQLAETDWWMIVDWMDECEDILDTAALVEQLDLVISVDTSVAHLAGAMGKPVWLLNRFNSEWRWMLEREDSPWYPTMKIFRQAKSGDWNGVIEKIGYALRKLIVETRSSGKPRSK